MSDATKTESSQQFLTPVVYTMGKVASSSVSRAILDAELPCHDIHSLAPEYLRRVSQDWLSRGEFPPPHICISMAHRDRLLIKRQKCLYVTLVRDPLSRNLSAFFQNLHLQKAEIRNEADARKMFSTFQETYGHTIPNTWMDREFGDQLGIDVYKRRFDTEKKHVVLRGMNTVIFRVDCSDKVKSNVLSRLLGRTITVKRENDSDNKEYHEIYKNVQEVAYFAPEFVARMYTSKFSRHFWSLAERQKMAQRWVLPENADELRTLIAK